MDIETFIYLTFQFCSVMLYVWIKFSYFLYKKLYTYNTLMESIFCNPAFTGFFNDGHKRIDLILVIKDTNSNEIEETRLNFLMNAIKLDLELEIEQGKLPEHKNLMFIKVHAPDAIIEEFGIYFKERKFFKESHIEFINPLFNFLGMQHERELIKLIRNQYPGPVNYSTLERSKIVYQILLQLQFGQYENHFGINKLIRRKIILDAFALHDGPYFIQSKQEPRKYVNARQVLFYNWTGIINIWKTQPIHMIQEYLGKRIAFFFAYYEYFNMMLIIISAVGTWIALAHYFEKPQYDIITKSVCSKRNFYGFYMLREDIVCSECRNFTICPFLKQSTFCKELKFINRIDTEKMRFYAYFVTIWGLIYVVLWKRREKYLLWMWEVHEKYVKKIARPEYESHTNIYKESKRTGILLEYESIHISIIRGLIILISVAIFSAWVFALILISIYMCYFKHWYTYIKKTSFDQWKRHEHEYIGMAAIMYTSTIFVFKVISTTISLVLTEFEKHKTFRSYDRSLAIKMYAFCFSCTFTLLTTYIFVGELFFTHILDMRNWYSLGGFALLNNGLGTSLDDICVTLAVIVVVEQILFKIPTFFYNQTTDYNQVRVLDVNTPCWEREYKLPNVTETLIHDSYCTIAIQFALTLFSCAFPLTPLIILLINIWEIRHKARKLLLGHRRPLLLNVSGPGIWHRLIFVTAHVVPLFNVAMIIFQSRLLHRSLPFGFVTVRKEWRAGIISIHEFAAFKEYTEQYEKSIKPYIASWDKHTCISFDEWIDDRGKNFDEPTQRWWFLRSIGLEFMLFFEGSLLLMSLWVHFLCRPNANDIQDTIKMENKIKQKFYIRKGFSE